MVTASFSLKQKIALSVIPRVTGTLSILGSGAIICRVFRCRERRGGVYHRLMLGMSTCDVVASFAIALSTWPVPRWYPRVYGARGNAATCEAQGFVVQMFGFAVPMCNACLGVYYLLVIRYRWQESRLRRVAAPWMHAAPVVVGAASAVACLLLNLLNPTNVICWIGPPVCERDPTNDGGELSDCTTQRQDRAGQFVLAFLFFVLFLSLFVATASMALVYRSVERQERAVARYRYSQSGDNREQTRKVAKQALLYVLALWATWTPMIVNALVAVSMDSRPYGWFALTVVEVIFIPLQGFLNAIVYFRPLRIYERYRAENPDSITTRVCNVISSRFNRSPKSDSIRPSGKDDHGNIVKVASMAAKSSDSSKSHGIGGMEGNKSESAG